MNINPVEGANHLECIRCGSCRRNCPKSAIDLLVMNKKLKSEKD